MPLFKRAAFPTTLAGVSLPSSVSSGVSTVYIKPTPSAGSSLQGSWKPGYQSFESVINWGVLWPHLSIQVSFLCPCKPVCSMHREREGIASWYGVRTKLECMLAFGREDGFSGFPVQVLFQATGSPFLICFCNSPSFLCKSSPADFCLFCLFWPFPMAP